MRNFIFSFLALILLPMGIYAQSIKGKVSDENGLPLPGVSVTNTVSNASTVSDFDGNFSVAAQAGNPLKFTFIGYNDVTMNASDGMTLSMQVASTNLNEVVVIGYGTTKKADITGSIAVVKEKEFKDRPNANPLSSLQGKVAGVIITNSGKPGDSPGIYIRGIGSVAYNDPIYIVDGTIANNISYLNPNDIESMSILKDASSSAIYGIRAANGVIVITTKMGKKGRRKY
ncbi:TonB-dependent receptor plug domain-containing protein [Flavobacterium sp. 3HN19-14]|uniref:TonB-dependent receptor plug domain-containing protein n=1 Tax=Flavobacterium sp. 3HN19-14 TaxID=3448133 RepID=UPI003EE17121